MKQKRRARKQPLQLDEMQPTELSPANAVVADIEAPEPENAVSEIALPAKARRGRKPNVSSALETAEASAAGTAASSDDQTSVVEAVDLVSALIPVKGRRKRTINSQPSQPQSASQADPIDDARETDASLAREVDAGMPAIASSVAKWNAAMGTISFDWPAIEQTAAAQGPNQVMAKLLLAARAEGANSRWPF
ncbi:MAG: hypothetical protein EOO77_11570 [Oxalobacteraceae bacterium]|nr:MAG: hypothetical protein EOO77_11570 [Oxalobacteraceae bacterium]